MSGAYLIWSNEHMAWWRPGSAGYTTHAEAAAGLDFICLGTNASGRPKHPMARGKARIPDDQEPVPFRLAM